MLVIDCRFDYHLFFGGVELARVVESVEVMEDICVYVNERRYADTNDRDDAVSMIADINCRRYAKSSMQGVTKRSRSMSKEDDRRCRHESRQKAKAKKLNKRSELPEKPVRAPAIDGDQVQDGLCQWAFQRVSGSPRVLPRWFKSLNWTDSLHFLPFTRHQKSSLRGTGYAPPS